MQEALGGIMSSEQESSALRDEVKRLRSRIYELESAIGSSEGEDAQIAAYRFTQAEFERGLQASQVDVVRLEKLVDDLIDANNREVDHRRRAKATVQLMRDVIDVIGKVELGDDD